MDQQCWKENKQNRFIKFIEEEELNSVDGYKKDLPENCVKNAEKSRQMKIGDKFKTK